MANLSTTTDLVINKLSQAKYNQLCAAGQLDPYQLYLTDGVALDAGNNQIVNVANPILSSDAANKAYVDSSLSNIDLNDYYKKTETSSASQISIALENFQPAGNPVILPKAVISRSNGVFALSANCTNVLQQSIEPGNVLALEDYDDDNTYVIELTASNSTSAVSFEILAHTIANNVEGLYDIGLGSQLSTLSPNQKYKFSISHEKLHIENDNALRSLSSSAIAVQYVGNVVNFYPVVDSFNSINASNFNIVKAFIVIPQSIKSDNFTKSRSFSLQVLNHTSANNSQFSILLSAVDAGGANVNFYTVEGDAISSIIDQDLSSYQVVFEETTPGNFLVSRKGYSSGSGNQRYALTTANGTLSSGSIVYNVDDQEITTIQISSSTTPVIINMPNKPSDGGARDFILRVEVTASSAPTVSFNFQQNEECDFESDDDSWMNIEPGLNLISFTETK